MYPFPLVPRHPFQSLAKEQIGITWKPEGCEIMLLSSLGLSPFLLFLDFQKPPPLEALPRLTGFWMTYQRIRPWQGRLEQSASGNKLQL